MVGGEWFWNGIQWQPNLQLLIQSAGITSIDHKYITNFYFVSYVEEIIVSVCLLGVYFSVNHNKYPELFVFSKI